MTIDSARSVSPLRTKWACRHCTRNVFNLSPTPTFERRKDSQEKLFQGPVHVWHEFGPTTSKKLGIYNVTVIFNKELLEKTASYSREDGLIFDEGGHVAVQTCVLSIKLETSGRKEKKKTAASCQFDNNEQKKYFKFTFVDSQPWRGMPRPTLKKTVLGWGGNMPARGEKNIQQIEIS